MFLRSLTLKGFKSFADATTLELEPGVTVVVGPNGSGKSNVVDAVAWVLGAQGPRTVRSSKMDDVIFAGSSRRPALGRAEVSLTIDNSSRLLPIDFTEVTITRTLFRTSGESEYALNGVPCRLLDVQELLSDTGVGRQQHVIVSQGNLDAVLEARPEERRLIIEEAAGILKFRRRKEKAERRLDGTEANLVRLGDLLREVRRQLRPLERQADAARRHGAVVEELRALRLYVTGRQLSVLATTAENAVAATASLAAEESALKVELAGLDDVVAAAERSVSQGQGSRLAETAGRLEALRERARGLNAVLAERQRSLEKQRSATLDAALGSALEADADRLSRELGEVEEAAFALPARFEELAAAEAELAREQAEAGEAVARLHRAAEVRGELSALRAAVDRDRAEAARTENRLAILDGRAAELADEVAGIEAEVAGIERDEKVLGEALAGRTSALSAAGAEVADAEARLRDAQSERAGWEARADGLALALEEESPSAEQSPLDATAGVIGVLRDLVSVDKGWEVPFDAAVSGLLGAVVVDGVESARAVLARLAEKGAAATVVAPGVGAAAATATGQAADRVGDAPGRGLRPHVTSKGPGGERVPEVERWLDIVLGTTVVVEGGWEEAVDVALAHPSLLVVTRDGGRFGPRGWRVGAGREAMTALALAEAREKAGVAEGAVSTAQGRHAAAVRRRDEAVSAAAAAEADLDMIRRRRVAAAARLARAQTVAHEGATEAQMLRTHRTELGDRVDQGAARVAALAPLVDSGPGHGESGSEPSAERAEIEEQARVAALHRVEERFEAVHSLRTELEVLSHGLAERRTYLTRRRAEVDERLERAGGDREGARAQREQLDLVAARTARLAALGRSQIEDVEAVLRDIGERRRRQAEVIAAVTDRLTEERSRRSAAERRLEEVRERARRAELEEAESRLRLESAVESVRRDLDCEPQAALDATCPPLADGISPPSRVRELERELRLMGPINPLALEELTSLEERHTFLSTQLDDIRSTRRELVKVIRAVDAEMVQLLAAAYADVADNFKQLFETLFPGGHGQLRLTDPDNLLDTGIEIEARPFGKNVRKLSLLSGGERSLCALAFLFAVFRSRPSPFYLLDEVEAALDDVNLHRFLDLLHEFRQEAQLLVVSHQKRTMEAADSLYGVTMQPGGSSRVLSERLRSSAPSEA